MQQTALGLDASLAVPDEARHGHGESRFLDRGDRERIRSAAAAARMLYVEVSAPTPALRGQLGETIEAAVEEVLQKRGAAPPGVTASSDCDASLSDQLFRARSVGARGVAIVVGDLRPVTHRGCLDAEDSAALRFYVESSRDRAVHVYLSPENVELAGYGSALPLAEAVGLVRSRFSRVAEPPKPTPAPPPPPVAESQSDAAPVAPPERPEPPRPIIPERPATVPPKDDAWRGWVTELAATQGPKPLAQVERLFATKYMPLLVREAQGDLPEEAVRVREAWGHGFAKSYAEAFGTFRVTGKRPTMVLDAPQVASRLARLHGARHTELVLVDAMRFDLGQRVKSRIRAALGESVACAEEVLLWSALPTMTGPQLDALAHGAEALGRRTVEEDDTVLRGRNVTTLRRVRLGTREVKKLDVLEARLRDPDGPLAPRLLAAADEAAQALATYFSTLSPRTLVFVFGDHGFSIDGDGRTSSAAEQGGALPEQVLVPGFAFLSGEVH